MSNDSQNIIIIIKTPLRGHSNEKHIMPELLKDSQMIRSPKVVKLRMPTCCHLRHHRLGSMDQKGVSVRVNNPLKVNRCLFFGVVITTSPSANCKRKIPMLTMINVVKIVLILLLSPDKLVPLPYRRYQLRSRNLRPDPHEVLEVRWRYRSRNRVNRQPILSV